MAPLYSTIPAPPIPPNRWPNLINTLGGEAAIRAEASKQGIDRWASGVTWPGGDCLQPIDNSNAAIPCDPVALNFVTGELSREDALASSALVYWQSASCSTFGTSADEVSRRATDKLRISSSHLIEEELWRGTAHTAGGLPDVNLDTGAVLVGGGTAVPFVRALADLQFAFASKAQGQRGMVHVTPRTAKILASRSLLFREGGLLFDLEGNQVVVGTGYAGATATKANDASGNTAWMFMTLPVHLLLGDIQTFAEEEIVNVTDNYFRSVAFRPAVAYFDTCASFVINVDHTAELV